MSQHGPGPPAPGGKGFSPSVYILIGLFLYAAGAVMFFYFARLEKTGEAASMHAAVALLYNLGGKWLVAAVCALIGTGSLIGGIVGLLKARQ